MSAPPISATYDAASIPSFMSPSRCVLLEVNGDIGTVIVSAATTPKTGTTPVPAVPADFASPTKGAAREPGAKTTPVRGRTPTPRKRARDCDMTQYEREREERIARNKTRLEAVQLAAKELHRVASTTSSKTAGKGFRKNRKKTVDAPAPREPARKSSRIRGAPTSYSEIGDDDKPIGGDAMGLHRHLTCEEYCIENGLEPGPRMSGFHGWIEEGVRAKLGIEESAEDAWVKNGGGKFDRKPAKGESAREYAQRMLYKNPNAYFYRHLVSGETQNSGDWSEAEIKHFVEVAKEHGCGDKWGLFASYIPNRVGYQCSACYRHQILPRGLLCDDNWLMTPSGEAIWNGKKSS